MSIEVNASVTVAAAPAVVFEEAAGKVENLARYFTGYAGVIPGIRAAQRRHAPALDARQQPALRGAAAAGDRPFGGRRLSRAHAKWPAMRSRQRCMARSKSPATSRHSGVTQRLRGVMR